MLSHTAHLETAKALLAGELPLAESLGLRLEYTPHFDNPKLMWLFQVENLLKDYSEQDSRCLVVPRGVLSLDEADCIDNDIKVEPELVARAFNTAAQSALRTLAKLSEETDDLSCRFRARLCVACREELKALLSEHAEMVKHSQGVA